MLLAKCGKSSYGSPQCYWPQPLAVDAVRQKDQHTHAHPFLHVLRSGCECVRAHAVSSAGTGRGNSNVSVTPTAKVPEVWAHVDSYHFMMANSSHMYANVSVSTSGDVRIVVRLEYLSIREPCFLHWGLYRGSLAADWMLPEAAISKDSVLRADLQTIHTPLVPVDEPPRASRDQSYNNFPERALEATVYLPKSLHPCFLTGTVFVEEDPLKGYLLQPKHSRFVSIPVGVSRGSVTPLGATVLRSRLPKWDPASAGPRSTVVNDESSLATATTTRSNNTSSGVVPTPQQPSDSGMTLRLMRLGRDGLSHQTEKSLDLALHPSVHRTGDVWHIQVDNLRNLHSMVYAWEAIGPLGWRGQLRFAPGTPLLDPYATQARRVRLPQSEAGGREIWAGVLHTADTGNMTADEDASALVVEPEAAHLERPRHSMEESFLLEVDPVTFAGVDHVSDPRIAGTWLGVLEGVAEIGATGATTVVLPCAMLRGDGLGVQGLAALSYFVADGRYAAGDKPESAAEEFNELVKGLHARGLEVLMQVELCFTAEGDDTDPTVVSMRGLDNALYYRPNALLNLAQPPVPTLVRDALIYWTKQHSLDGFVLLSAEAIAQSADGTVLDAPPLAEVLAADGALKGCKLVAWPRDYGLLPRNGRRGFPHAGALLQHNGAFGAVLQWLGGGGPGLLTSVATQLTGNASMLQADWSPEAGLPGNLAVGRRPSFGINTISSPLVDGTTLQSWLDSVLGPESAGSRKQAVLAKSAIMLMMLARGTPQASAQDLDSAEIAGFYKAALTVRLKEDWSKLMRPLQFEEFCDVQWFAGHGHEPNWDQEGPGSEVLGFIVREGGALGKAISVVVNSADWEVRVSLPQTPGRSLWTVVLDTGAMSPDDVLIESGGRKLPAGSGLVLAPKAAAFLFAEPSSPMAVSPVW